MTATVWEFPQSLRSIGMTRSLANSVNRSFGIVKRNSLNARPVQGFLRRHCKKDKVTETLRVAVYSAR